MTVSHRHVAYYTKKRRRFHAVMGLRRVGKFTDCAEKFGHRYSVVWMEKRLSAAESRL